MTSGTIQLQPILWHNPHNSMEVICPTCRSKIATGDMNVSTDVALCRACGNTFRLSEIVGATPFSFFTPTAPIDLNAPPSGAWYTPTADGFTAGASTRSWMALFIVPFTCIWSGGSMFGIYGTQIIKGHFNLGISLFGIPFLLGSILLISSCAMTLAGKVTVTLSGDRLSVFTGVGPLGFTRLASLSEFTTAREDFGYGSMNSNRQSRVIRLEGTRAMAFGSMLNTERRFFLLSAMQKALRDTGRANLVPQLR